MSERPPAHAHPSMQFSRTAPAGTMRVESRGRVNINANRRGPESRVGGLYGAAPTSARRSR